MVLTMKKIALLILVVTSTATTLNISNISPTAGVCLSGAIISSEKDSPVAKYKRKDCPVCKGKGWYISGDGIAKVDCGYCEPEVEEAPADITDITKG